MNGGPAATVDFASEEAARGHGRIARGQRVLERLAGGSTWMTVVHVMMLAAASIAVALCLWTPNSYTNLFLRDQLYLLNAAYLIFTGHVPHVDFAWQFGGYESYLVALAFRWFGVSFKALEQATAFSYAVALALLYLGAYRRTHPLTFILLFVLLTATSLTRFPFENGTPDLAVQTYAMFYNRTCWALAIVLFASLIGGEGRLLARQLLAAAVCIFLIMTTKVTFAVLLPPAAALIVWRGGWRGLGIVAAAMLGLALLAWLFLDYGPAAHLGAIRDILDATRQFRGLRFGPLHKLAYILYFNLFGFLALLAGAAYLAIRLRRSRPELVYVAAIVTLLALSALAAVATGTFYALTTTLPMIAFAAIMLSERALMSGGLEARERWVFVAGLSLYALAFSGPYLANFLAGVAKQVTRGEQSLFTRGPLAGLIVDKPDLSSTPTFADAATGVSYVARRTELERNGTWLQDYELIHAFKDGIDLAQRQPGFERLGIAAFYPSIFPFALGSPPLRIMPLLPAARADKPAVLPAEVDAVLVMRGDKDAPLHRYYLRALSRDFEPVDRSALWEVHMRRRDEAIVAGDPSLRARR
ncbi:MAG TPA: hypothetical protein VF628_04295 [Allosphingosinicella sp.]|jgi:hypothetical protein